MRHTTTLGKLTIQTFLKRYWQKSPRLIRQAFPDIISPISPNELAGLSCEPGVESRLVIKTRKKPGWLVRHGPFKTADFKTLPEKNWTLLVHDSDKHLPELADVLENFHFIPSWRIDDLMISYAVDGGSVGPHVDSYDVFLLQVQGQRRWCITQKQLMPLVKQGLELSLVRSFRPQHEWLLNPGDMLYLPPGVAHHGTAVGECMTFSIGMRAPADVEMLADLDAWLIKRTDMKARYTDPGLLPATSDPGQIRSKTRAKIRKRVRDALHMDNDGLDEWFGCFITEPKPWLAPGTPRRRLTPETLKAQLTKHGKLLRNRAISMLWCAAGSRQIKLFSNGHCHVLPAGFADFARMLCSQRIYTKNMLAFWLRKRLAARLLAELYNQGLLYFP